MIKKVTITIALTLVFATTVLAKSFEIPMAGETKFLAKHCQLYAGCERVFHESEVLEWDVR